MSKTPRAQWRASACRWRPIPNLAWLGVVMLSGMMATATSAQSTAFGTCETETVAPAPVVEALDRLLNSFVDPDDPKAKLNGYAPGAVLSVKAPGWRYIKPAGHTTKDGDTPIDCAMPFQIGSATKMMTATVLLQLHEEGALSIDDLLSVYLPDTAAALPNGTAITLRQLATHTSGVFNYTDNAPDGGPGLMEGGLKDPGLMAKNYTPMDLIEFVIQHGAPKFAPGEAGAWSYSNTGYVLLGLIIEKITGKPLATVFDERIFGPLSMEKTFLWNDVPEPDFGLPSSYWKAPFTVDATTTNLSQAWAAGGVISTAVDMSTFIRALLKGQLFKNDGTLDLMQQTVPTGIPVMPGYGIGLIEKQPGFWGHGGQTLGYATDVAYFAGDDISVVVWTTSANNMSAVGALSIYVALHATGIIKEK